MIETQMIPKLEHVIRTLGNRGLDTSSCKRFFDVGEWLISFEGVENLVNANGIVDESILADYRELTAYFADVRD